MDFLHALVLGIIEGITEFLPVSSTGHLVLVGDAIGFDGRLAVTFDIVIQLGAILAVVWLFRDDLVNRLRRLPTDRAEQHFAGLILLAFLPAALVGFVVHDYIEAHLFTALTVGLAQIVGAVIILLVDRKKEVATEVRLETITIRQSILIGLAQIVALWPGMSRSGSSIIGGMLAGLDRQTATRFSFYLAIPTMVAATGYTLVKHHDLLNANDAAILAVGFMTSFVVAMIAIKTFLRYVAHHTFAVFAWYRIALGLVVLGLAWAHIL